MAAFTDSFTGIAGDDLETRTGWTRVDGTAGAAEIGGTGTVLRCNTSDSAGAAYQAPSAGSADHYAQCSLPQALNSAVPFGACVRVVDRSNFIGARQNNAAGGYELFKKVGGTFTSLGTFTTTFTAGDVLKVAIAGTSVTVSVNGIARIGPVTVSDAVFTGVQTPGVVARAAIWDPWIDDWESPQAAAGGGTTFQPAWAFNASRLISGGVGVS